MLLMQSKKQNTSNTADNISAFRQALEQAEAIMIGAGAGLSTAAGFSYSGERFQTYFQDFGEKYHFKNMYTGGFYPYETLNEHWAYWSRYIYINRYMNPPTPVYHKLLNLVKDKDYFVLTTNVDHCFQKAGFDKQHLFYTQGDYGLFQCGKPCHEKTYDNKERIRDMVLAQGYQITPEGSLYLPEGITAQMSIPDEQIPFCPKCGSPMSMNLRADDTFVQDEGWYQAARWYEHFLKMHKNAKILFLEIGVGYNTPGIIKYPFWQMTYQNPKAIYACINYGEAHVPEEIKDQAICMDEDVETILNI